MINDITLSLCMICKNEAEHIQTCIRSVKPLVDEIIIADTGSQDQTRELARAEGGIIYEFPWNDNFAAARNFALDQAAGQWVLVLDADELLTGADREGLHRLIQAPAIEGYYITICSYVGKGEATITDQAVRLFKNNPRYRFRGAIHEQIADSIQEHNGAAGLGFAPLTIEHCGYLDKEKAVKNKPARNVAIIKKALRNAPDDPFLLYSLGIEYMQAENWGESAAQFKHALRFLRGCEGYFPQVLTMLGTALLSGNAKAELSDLLANALTMLPGNTDLHLLRGLLAYAEQEYGVVITELESISGQDSDILPQASILRVLGDAYRLTGRSEAARQQYLEVSQLVAKPWP